MNPHQILLSVVKLVIDRITGGVSTNPNSTALPDWVDSSVADWIKSESKAMELAWGPADTRGALAFVHIPPYAAPPLRSLLLRTNSSIFASHAVQALQTNLDSTKNPGLNGMGVLPPPFVTRSS